ncbi:MAG: carbon-nitrogen hydrolase family protein [Armatimonadia bacterium]
MLRNPDFSAPDGALPEHWAVWQPAAQAAGVQVQPVPEGLLMASPREPFCVGGVQQEVTGIVGGQAYAFTVECLVHEVPYPYQAIGVRVDWLREGKLVDPAGRLVSGPTVTGEHTKFEDVLVAPEGADAARILLECHWLQGGTVTWQSAGMAPAEQPAPRKVKVGTVYLRPQNTTPEQNLELWCDQIREAGRLGLDIVCLCEAMLSVGTGKSGIDVAEPIPGPATERLGQASREANVWVVACLNERVGERVYNTGVLLDRQGNVAGKYHKTHLPREEWRQGVTPGSEYPVFKTDFGTVAIQICYDWFFPEVVTAFAAQGAEIVFAPTWGTTFADKEGKAEGETVFRVRARDNGVYMVPSVYDGSSMVIDPLGRILASSEGQTGVFWAEVDLSEREPLWWVGHWRAIGPRDRMPYTYAPLVDPMQGPTY